jgi:hypothetical protein
MDGTGDYHEGSTLMTVLFPKESKSKYHYFENLGFNI